MRSQELGIAIAAFIHDNSGQWAEPGDLASTSNLAALSCCEIMGGNPSPLRAPVSLFVKWQTRVLTSLRVLPLTNLIPGFKNLTGNGIRRPLESLISRHVSASFVQLVH